MKNFWIFQSVPSRFDLRDENNLYSGKDGWWYATRYRTKMAPGDAVFFWMGGDSDVRGIYGFGHITSLPYEDGDSHKVKVHVTKRLRRHIGIEKIKQHPALQNLMILKIAVGSNFLLSGAEGDALAEMTRKEA